MLSERDVLDIDIIMQAYIDILDRLNDMHPADPMGENRDRAATLTLAWASIPTR
jgi:hypothetical protein